MLPSESDLADVPESLREEATKKYAKIKANELVGVFQMFEDDAAEILRVDRAVHDDLLGTDSSAGEEGDDTRMTIIADDININKPPPSPPPQEPRPIPPVDPPPRPPTSSTSPLVKAALIGLGLVGAGGIGAGLGAVAYSLLSDEPPAATDTDTRNTIRFED